ncbi:MAG: DinB family protein [Roseiflexaceae bacterium]|jgi:hypothetical protein
MTQHATFFAALHATHTRTHEELQAILANTDPVRLRTRPHPEMNTMVWSIWHSYRCEDACIGRFVVPEQQVLTTQNFNARMNIPYLGDGMGMTADDVLALSAAIDINALAAYGNAVTAQSTKAYAYMADWDFGVSFTEAEVRAALTTYADLASDDGTGTIEYMLSMTKAEYVMKFLYGHSQYHLGEISAIDGQISGTRFFTW